jgi:hypothetical protein
MKVLLAAVLALSVPGGLLSDDTTLGTGVKLKDATPISALVKAPKDYVGKTVRIDGVATAVCQAMGCWLAVAESDAKDAPTLRLKVEDGVIVFPMSAKGKKVSAEGTFESIGGHDEHAKEAAHEHAKADAKASTQFHIKATGAIIR